MLRAEDLLLFSSPVPWVLGTAVLLAMGVPILVSLYRARPQPAQHRADVDVDVEDGAR
jgi:hypothetical protein